MCAAAVLVLRREGGSRTRDRLFRSTKVQPYPIWLQHESMKTCEGCTPSSLKPFF